VWMKSDAITPLAAAVEFGGSDGIAIVQVLVEAGADLQCSAGHSRSRQSLIHVARDCAMLRHLLDLGFDSNAPDGNRSTALLSACSRLDEDMVRMLILHGANVDASDSLGISSFALLWHPDDEAKVHRIRLMLVAAGCTTGIEPDLLRSFWEPLTSMDASERATAVALRHTVAATRCSLVRERALQIAVGLQSADLPVLVTLTILDECFYLQFATLVPAFRKWAWLKHVKHWRHNKNERDSGRERCGERVATSDSEQGRD
jgi:hypothetical protein